MTNEIHEVLKLSKSKELSFIKGDDFVKIVANNTDEDGVLQNQIVKNVHNGLYNMKTQQTVVKKEVLNLLPKYLSVNISKDTLVCGNRTIKYVENDRISKPIEVYEHLTSIKGEELKHLLNCEYAMATDMVRPILNGICIDENNFAALDGYRLAVRNGNFKADERVVISKDVVKVLKNIKYKGIVEVYFNEEYIKFVFDNLEVIGSIIPGDYIKYNSIIPEDCRLKVELNIKEMLNVLKDYKKNKLEFVKLNFDEDYLIMQAENEVSKVKEELKIEMEGQPLEIAFNVNYLIDTLKNYENATFELSDPVSPLVVKSENKLDLVLPVRLKK